jgi:hypothetical protein
MRLPGYNADAALYRTSKNYHVFEIYDNLREHEKVLQQARSLGYECDDERGTCTCRGVFDCFRLGQSKHCRGGWSVCIGPPVNWCECEWTSI